MTDEDRDALMRASEALNAGDLGAAGELCRAILDRADGEPNALNLLGAVALAREAYGEAERLIGLALAAEPGGIAAQFNMARVYEATERYGEAAESYANIFERSPGEVQVAVRLGVVLSMQGRLDDAVRAFGSAVRVAPDHRFASLNLAIVQNQMGRYEDSVRVLRAILALHPDFVEALIALADSLYELHRGDEALEAARAALALAPDDPQALVLFGQAECERGAYEHAEALFVKAAAADPTRPEAEMNLGVLLQRLQRVDEAIVHGERAVAVAPENALAHFNLAMAYLLKGDYARGWPEFEWRMRDPRLRAHFPYLGRIPLWDGEPMPGREVLVAREQGLGDFVLFSRLLPLARERGVVLVVEVPEEIAPLYRNVPGIDEAIVGRASRRRARTFGAHIPICSLPAMLGLEERTIPRAPYLHADPKRVRHFQERFAGLGKRLKVGIAWAGSDLHLLDRYRSCRLAEFGRLRDLDVAWVSLQKGAAESELDGADGGLAPLALGPELRGYDDTAAAIAALDLVISVDTSVAHVAGALGAPVWTLHGFGSFWVWGLQRSDSPWYPSMRLFRQREPGRWDTLFDDVHAALAAMLQREAPEG